MIITVMIGINRVATVSSTASGNNNLMIIAARCRATNHELREIHTSCHAANSAGLSA